MPTKKTAKSVKVKDLKPAKGGKVSGGRKSGEGQKDFLTWDFTNLRIKSYDVAFTDGPPLDVVTFSFTQVTMTYRPQDIKGGLGAAVTVTWNVKSDKVS